MAEVEQKDLTESTGFVTLRGQDCPMATGEPDDQPLVEVGFGELFVGG